MKPLGMSERDCRSFPINHRPWWRKVCYGLNYNFPYPIVVRFRFTFIDWGSRRIFGLEGFSKKRIGVLWDLPKLFWKRSLVKMTEFFKSKATLSIRLADGIPIYPMKFPFARIMSPPKIFSDGVQFVANSFRYFKVREGIERHDLQNRGDKGSYAYLG